MDRSGCSGNAPGMLGVSQIGLTADPVQNAPTTLAWIDAPAGPFGITPNYPIRLDRPARRNFRPRTMACAAVSRARSCRRHWRTGAPAGRAPACAPVWRPNHSQTAADTVTSTSAAKRQLPDLHISKNGHARSNVAIGRRRPKRRRSEFWVGRCTQWARSATKCKAEI